MSKNSITREFKNKISYKKAIIVVCIALLIIFIFLSSVASTNTRTNSSLENIDWGMSPDEVEYITKDFSRDTKFFKNGQRSVLIQRERITESEIAAKSVVEYFFENEQLRNIKITKAIKYWPDHILDQLLRVTVANYDISYASDILRAGQTYSSENQNESKLIYIGYDDSLKPEYAYVELSSKHNL